MIQEIINIFWLNPIGQTLGILGMLCVIYAFSQKDDKRVVMILIISHLFWIGHFYFMDIYTGLAVAGIGFFRLVMSLKYKRNKKIFGFFICLIILSGAYTYKDPASLLPIVASLLGTYGFFFLEKVQLRMLLLLCSMFWLNFHYLHFSIGGVINETVLQLVHIFTIYRLMHDEGKTLAIFSKIKAAISTRPKIDYGRYLAVIDYVSWKKKR